MKFAASLASVDSLFPIAVHTLFCFSDSAPAAAATTLLLSMINVFVSMFSLSNDTTLAILPFLEQQQQ